MSTCQAIEKVLNKVTAEGNSILSTAKSELMDKVIWMKKELPLQLKYEIQTENAKLSYDKSRSKPQNPSTEFFICHACKTVIVFPVKPEE